MSTFPREKDHERKEGEEEEKPGTQRLPQPPPVPAGVTQNQGVVVQRMIEVGAAPAAPPVKQRPPVPANVFPVGAPVPPQPQFAPPQYGQPAVNPHAPTAQQPAYPAAPRYPQPAPPAQAAQPPPLPARQPTQQFGTVAHPDPFPAAPPPPVPARAAANPELKQTLQSAGAQPPPAIAPQPVRQVAPPLPMGPAKESLWDSVEALLDDVDASFDAVLAEGAAKAHQKPISSPSRSPSGGLSGARELFGQLAAAHVRNVRDFMIDVKSGQATTDWLPVCEPAVRSVRKMAEQLDLPPLCVALDSYLKALEFAAGKGGFAIEAEVRHALIDSYGPLIAAMPQAFSLDDVKSAREGIIVQSLLLQIPEVRKVTMDKLYAAGLTSLDVLFLAKGDEIAMTTGVDRAICDKIVEKFRAYRRDMQAAPRDDKRSFEHERLAELGRELKKQHDAFEAADRADDSGKKRDARKARDTTLLEIKVLLARLGEVDRVAQIDKLPYNQKISQLEAFLEAATKA